jgi:ASC-1-like (ASCH) protein
VKVITDDLTNLDKGHPKVGEYQAALAAHDKEVKEREAMLAKTSREWNAELDRLRLEPLSKVLPALREKYNRTEELKPKFRTELKEELTRLQVRLLGQTKEIVGSGDRKAWVNEFLKVRAQESKEQAETLKSMIKDADFPYAEEQEQTIQEALDAMARVIAYQGTWNLQVNVAPFAEVTILQADKELATDSTPVGINEMEVVGSSYIVEICWPTRKDAKLTVKQEIKDLHNNQTVVIRGDLSKGTVKQERKEPK